jgi:ABC-type uncharacterized transport system ATPase subunit
VRHLQGIAIPLETGGGRIRHLILTGKNGSGKSGVLDAVAGYIDAICEGGSLSEMARGADEPARVRHGVGVEFNVPDADVYALYTAGGCVFAYFRAQRAFVARVPEHVD